MILFLLSKDFFNCISDENARERNQEGKRERKRGKGQEKCGKVVRDTFYFKTKNLPESQLHLILSQSVSLPLSFSFFSFLFFSLQSNLNTRNKIPFGAEIVGENVGTSEQNITFGQ